MSDILNYYFFIFTQVPLFTFSLSLICHFEGLDGILD